jgi:hypothetical protein
VVPFSDEWLAAFEAAGEVIDWDYSKWFYET